MLNASRLSRTFKHKHGAVKALDNVSIEIAEGEFISIAGPSGSGKSTLLLTLGGMSHPDEGSVSWNNQSIYEWDITTRSRWRGSNVGFVFQSFNLVPYLNVFQNVSVGLSLSNKEAVHEQTIYTILEEVGLIARKDHLPSELSAGQQQRVALARALVKKPRLILADEPTGNLDPATGREVIDILRRHHASGTTVVMITHDPDIMKMTQRTVNIVDGKILS